MVLWYLLGVLTPFAVVGLLWVLLAVGVRAARFLDHRGFFVILRFKRLSEDRYSNAYLLKHDIYWERSWGPFFVGGWHRDKRGLNRWIGAGHTHAPHLVLGRRFKDT